MHDFHSNRIVNPSNERQERKKMRQKYYIVYRSKYEGKNMVYHNRCNKLMRYTIKPKKKSHTHTYVHTPRISEYMRQQVPEL